MTAANAPLMHHFDRRTKRLAKGILSYAFDRWREQPPLDGPRPEPDLRAEAGETVTAAGIGGARALEIWRDVLAPACISADHPAVLSYVPAAPSEAASMFDIAISATNVFAGSWQEGSGAVFAENEALRWLASIAGMPETSGGVFVSGGTAGNLSALIAARWRWRQRAAGRHDRTRGMIVTSQTAHSSVAKAAAVMDADVADVAVDDRGRMDGASARAALAALAPADRERVFAVVATGGTTNVGIVDDLRGVGEAARDAGAWFHVDAAYGGAAMVAPSRVALFDGIGEADSYIVDPHKWLFAPFDSCALLYREPSLARAAHMQQAAYLEPQQLADEWNPSDYAHHLSRRARGLPLWFSLATYGTDAYRDAVETTLRVSEQATELIRSSGHLELVMEPQLSVVMFRRRGWSTEDYYRWSDRVLRDGVAFIVPTSWKGETVLRICIVNPMTEARHIAAVVDSLATAP